MCGVKDQKKDLKATPTNSGGWPGQKMVTCILRWAQMRSIRTAPLLARRVQVHPLDQVLLLGVQVRRAAPSVRSSAWLPPIKVHHQYSSPSWRVELGLSRYLPISMPVAVPLLTSSWRHFKSLPGGPVDGYSHVGTRFLRLSLPGGETIWCSAEDPW